MTLTERYKRFKAWQLNAHDWSFDEHESHHCVNCGNDFVGNFCPHCAQKAGLSKVSWQSVLQSIAEVWGMNNRSFLYSLLQLIFRPGYFMSDYINGKRQVSFPPIKMLVLMGVISVIVDSLFKTTVINQVENGAPLVDQFFLWLKHNPGWGGLSMTCFFIVPTWCLFRYAPRNARHTLPQGFFIQVFMGIPMLIVDDLSDIFSDNVNYLIPLCYFYAYWQLFGYRFWGNFWRVLVVTFSGFTMAVVVMTLVELLTIVPEASRGSELEVMNSFLLIAVGPVLAGMLFSNYTYNRDAKKKEEQEQEEVLEDNIDYDNLETEEN